MSAAPRVRARVGVGVGWCIAAGLVLVAAAGTASAQAAQATTDVGPHYAGEPVSIRITAVGFEDDPAPSVEAPPTADGSLQLVGVSPSVSQSITIVNGRMSRVREVTHVFQFRFVPSRSGSLGLGPFRIYQGAREAHVPLVRLSVQEMPSNDDVRVSLELPPGDVFVGERVPVTVSFTMSQALEKNLLGYSLSVPLFDDDSAFRFLDEAGDVGSGRAETNVVIDTGSHQIELAGRTRRHSEGGKGYTTVSVTRTMVPLRQGEHALPGVSLSVEEGVRFRRDFFGGRRATQVRSWKAQDQGRVLVVTAIPGQEQPPSFGGAIGRGFTLEVSADRTVVQVGDPITLSLVVRGEGLETASLPALDAEGLLPSDGFRIPADVPTGELDGDAKHFTAVVRVLDDRQTEIPALAYTWFDPDAKRYETTHSRPIALSVRAAEVIGARDVLRGEPAEDGRRLANDDQGSGSAASALTGSLALTGADLAIATDPGAVLGRRSQGVDAWAVPTLYTGSLSLVAAALLDRRRRRVDPELSRRRRLLLGELSRVRAAGAQPPAEAAREIAAALRVMLRMVPEATSLELDELLGQCDARSFAPPGAGAPLEEVLVERAVALAESLASQGASR